MLMLCPTPAAADTVAIWPLCVCAPPVANGAKNAETYLGLLHSVENMRVYGYVTNTKIKFVVVLSALEGQVKDADVRAVREPLRTEGVLAGRA